jgi:hypothetical protein
MENRLSELTREELIAYATYTSQVIDQLVEVITEMDELIPKATSIIKDYDNKNIEALFYEYHFNRLSTNQDLS